MVAHLFNGYTKHISINLIFTNYPTIDKKKMLMGQVQSTAFGSSINCYKCIVSKPLHKIESNQQKNKRKARLIQIYKMNEELLL